MISKILIQLNKVFTRATGITLGIIGVLFLFQGSSNIDEVFAQLVIIFLGLFFLSFGIYYYFKSKKKIDYGK